MTANGYSVSFEGAENIPKLFCAKGYTTSLVC